MGPNRQVSEDDMHDAVDSGLLRVLSHFHGWQCFTRAVSRVGKSSCWQPIYIRGCLLVARRRGGGAPPRALLCAACMRACSGADDACMPRTRTGMLAAAPYCMEGFGAVHVILPCIQY